MITEEKIQKPDWFKTFFLFNGSIACLILPRILFFCGLTLTATLFYVNDYPIYLEKFGDLTTNVIYNLILGLLVVFRTNTSYDRFWEGRKAWGTIVLNSRCLSQLLTIATIDRNTQVSPPPSNSSRCLSLLSALAIATKLHLRGEKVDSTLALYLTEQQVEQLKDSKNYPLDVCFWLRQSVKQMLDQGEITDSEATTANSLMNESLAGVGSCERIISTPIPLTYRVYLKRLIVIYCLGLPFRLIPEISWWSIPIEGVVSFLLLGIEELARELENPFAYAANDLPVDQLCDTINQNVSRAQVLANSLGETHLNQPKL